VVIEGKMTLGDCLAVFKQKLKANLSFQPKTEEYYEFHCLALP